MHMYMHISLFMLTKSFFLKLFLLIKEYTKKEILQVII